MAVAPYRREDSTRDQRGSDPRRLRFSSVGFSVLLSPEQDWLIQPGPPRLGMRHPRRRYQRITAISNNQTQLISISLAFRVPVYRLPGERTRHHPSFCSRPSSPVAFRSKYPVWATATTGRKTTPRPQSPKAKYHSFLSSLGLPFFSGRSHLDHSELAHCKHPKGQASSVLFPSPSPLSPAFGQEK